MYPALNVHPVSPPLFTVPLLLHSITRWIGATCASPPVRVDTGYTHKESFQCVPSCSPPPVCASYYCSCLAARLKEKGVFLLPPSPHSVRHRPYRGEGSVLKCVPLHRFVLLLRAAAEAILCILLAWHKDTERREEG